MKCLDCQNDLVRLPTTQGPDLDVCPSGHGLWLDAGEVNCFVEDYLSLKQAISGGGGLATHTQAKCPRCAIQMDAETVAEAAIKSCGLCHGWWLAHGCLTQLNESYKGAAVAIRIDEQELYARAMTRIQVLSHLSHHQPTPGKTDSGNLWFWSLFIGLALGIAGIIFTAGIQKTLHTSRWSQPLDALFLYLLMGAAGGLWLFWYGWKAQQRKRLIAGIPTSPIRSLALGLVEVSGQAAPEAEPLISPFGGLPCVFYSYAVEERVQSGKNTRWQKLAGGTSEQPFFVRDATGQVLVVPTGATLVLPDERITRSNLYGELPPLTLAGLSRLGISSRGWIGNKTLRCRESLLLPNESIYVLGTALEHHGMSHHITNESRLYIGNGHDNAFIISDRSEKDLLSQLAWQMWAGFLGGIVLIVACAFIIFDQYLTTITPR